MQPLETSFPGPVFFPEAQSTHCPSCQRSSTGRSKEDWGRDVDGGNKVKGWRRVEADINGKKLLLWSFWASTDQCKNLCSSIYMIKNKADIICHKAKSMKTVCGFVCWTTCDQQSEAGVTSHGDSSQPLQRLVLLTLPASFPNTSQLLSAWMNFRWCYCSSQNLANRRKPYNKLKLQ